VRRTLLPLLLLSSLPLGGCAAGIAASAVGAAVNASRPRETNQDLRQPAVAACTARATPLGEVRIIDAEQRRAGRVTVWGTVQDAQQRRAFECGWNGQVSSFRLREIPAR
jgi:hypothetical protein